MRTLPPWDNPAASAYCQAVTGWTITQSTHSAAYNLECNKGVFNPQACSVPPLNQLVTNTYSVWSSDNVFCLPWSGDLWQLMLYLALVGWVFLTAVSLLQTYEWRGLTGFTLGELVKTVGRQIGLLVVASVSFSLLLAIHQVLFLFINGMVGGLPEWRVDSLWGTLVNLVQESQTATQNLDPNAAVSQLFGGNLPDSSGPFGMTWGQVAGGLGSFETFVVSALVPIRFVALFVAVISAPLAILCASTSLTRRLFFIWLPFWAEIEGLAVGSAIVLAAYQQIHHKLGSVAPLEHTYILLGLCGLVCGANLVFLWKIIGQFLGNITAFYQQQYQRDRQLVGVGLQAAVGALGALATVFTGGAALPAALVAEGLVSGATNLGATPGGGVPGAGVGQALIGAGRAAATYQRLQSWDAAREDATHQAEARYQAGQARQQEADARSAMRGAMRQLLPNSLRYSGDEEDDPSSAAGASGGAPWGSNHGSYGGSAPFSRPAPYAQTNGAQASKFGPPPPTQPPSVQREISDLLGQAPIRWEIKRDIQGALHDLHTAQGQATFDEGVRQVNHYLAAAQTQTHVRQPGPASQSLLDTLRQLAHPADQEGENDV